MKNRLSLVWLLLAGLVSACNTVPPAPEPAQSPIVDTSRTVPDAQPILQIDSGGHMSLIRDIFFTHDGKMLISASDDKIVRVWDLTSGKTDRILRGQIGPGDEGKIYAAALSRDNRWLALGGWLHPECAGQCGNIRLIDLASGQVVRLFKGHQNVIAALAFSTDNRYLVSGSGDMTARIWDIASGESVHTLSGHLDTIYAVAFSPDGHLVVTSNYDHSLKLWDSATGKKLADLHGHTGKVRSVAFTPDGRYLLSGSVDQTIRLWDGQTGAAIKVLARQDSSVASLTVSPDGTKVITGFSDAIDANNVFAIPSGERLASFSGHHNTVLATAISPDGNTAATGGGNNHEIYLWNIRTGAIQQRLIGRGEPIWSIGFAGDGRSIAWGRVPRTVEIMSLAALEHSFQLQDTTGNFSLTLGKPIDSTAQAGCPHRPIFCAQSAR
ncbi:WD40 repeat domain-containing protein [Nitrosomonas sp.]|uniref:WD40 repeat domain-containing protein n=1 Tax=Nitrosomonas sp. TaxID=42353 RepID=UPI0025CCEBE8|nr:WD40 repeat domain-containing protein [Nitrosomonas sp.]MBV6448975.1 hypothetical protein [Nitrosomonas sp.]